jgi:hypothetical protein
MSVRLSFGSKLAASWQATNSLVCVGLDPEPRKFPDQFRDSPGGIFQFNRAIIDATREFACAYKPQFAHYAAHSAENQLEHTIDYIKSTCPNAIVILDSKRGDIGSTAEQYAEEAFERYGADAVTVNPYLGRDSVEPFLTIGRTTSIPERDRIIQLEASDSIYGNATRYVYGVTNRFYAKQRRPGGAPSLAREIASVDVSQSYYTDARAAQTDTSYSTSFLGAPPSNYSPIALNARAAPTDLFSVTLRAEIDSQYLELRTISTNGSYSGSMVTATGGWSKRGFIQGLAAFNDPRNLDHYINASGGAHTRDNAVGATYSVNYDVLRSRLLQQRITGYYNSQCCGLAFEYQLFNFSGLATTVISGASQDRRFFMSVTLAGLGNFSPFNNALSGAPR